MLTENQFPCISIVMPIYNRSNTLSCAVESVLNQTYSNFELILVDDCSSDDSWQVMKSFNDNRISCYKLIKNSGASAARNFGISQSHSSYISFLDSDDYYEPDFLLETLKILDFSDENVGFMWTGVRYLENGKIKNFSWSPNLMETPYLTLLNALHIGTNSGITVKKIVFEKCGNFNVELPAAEDTEFFLRITKDFNFKYSNKVLVNIKKDGKDRLSKNFIKIAGAYNIFLKNHLSVIDENIFLKKKYYYKMMWLNYQSNDKKLARYYFRNIPVINYYSHLKFVVILIIYELFPLSIATKIHFKLAF